MDMVVEDYEHGAAAAASPNSNQLENLTQTQ